MSWKIATVGGAILPYEGRQRWKSIHKSIKKGTDYKTEEEISKILDVLIECQVKGILMIGDLGHTSSDTAERFRKGWLSPHFNAIPQQPLHVRESLKRHLDNLQSLSLQDFFKTLTILETISFKCGWSGNAKIDSPRTFSMDTPKHCAIFSETWEILFDPFSTAIKTPKSCVCSSRLIEI